MDDVILYELCAFVGVGGWLLYAHLNLSMAVLDKVNGQRFPSHVLRNPKEVSSDNESFIFRLSDCLQSEWKIRVLRFIWDSEGGELTHCHLVAT